MINEEEKYDADEASNDEQGTSVESRVLTTDLRHSQCERKPFKHLVIKTFMNNDYIDL